jgi:hypothetical protein
MDAVVLQEHMDRRLAERLQQQEDDGYRAVQSLMSIAACQPSVSKFAKRVVNTSMIPRLATTHQQGTEDDPIDLDTDDEPELGVLADRNHISTVLEPVDPMDLDDDDWDLGSMEKSNRSATSMDASLTRCLQEQEDYSNQAATGRRACVVCGDDDLISRFPSLVGCVHIPQTCAACYGGWVGAQLQGSGWKEAECPEDKCKVKLTYYEIQQTATPEIFQQYDNFIARAAISEDRKYDAPNLSNIVAS